MKQLTIVVPDSQISLSSIACIVGSCEMFTAANQYWKDTGRGELFKIQLAGVRPQVELLNGGLSLKDLPPVSSIRQTDLILIPALIPDFQNIADSNRQLADWIAGQYSHGAEVASMCTGAYILGLAGLLDGRKCSTHWSSANNFRTMFPRVIMQEDKLITDEHGIYTNGGGYSFLNLALYLVEKQYGRETAIYCSKMTQVEIDRQSQSPFIIFLGQHQHDDQVIKEAQWYIEKNLKEKITMEDLSQKFALSRRNFDRRFIKATGNTPIEYTQRVRVEWAKKAFETTSKTINEVMYDAGYNDVKAFREVFRKITGISPLEYRNKYNKEM